MLIDIIGFPGSGKSTLAQEINKRLLLRSDFEIFWPSPRKKSDGFNGFNGFDIRKKIHTAARKYIYFRTFGFEAFFLPEKSRNFLGWAGGLYSEPSEYRRRLALAAYRAKIEKNLISDTSLSHEICWIYVNGLLGRLNYCPRVLIYLDPPFEIILNRLEIRGRPKDRFLGMSEESLLALHKDYSNRANILSRDVCNMKGKVLYIDNAHGIDLDEIRECLNGS